MDYWLCLDTRFEVVGCLRMNFVYATHDHTSVYLCD